MQSQFGGHLVVISMVSKSIEKVYKEQNLCKGGLSFNTNDSMIVTGNIKGDITIRNLLHSNGNPNHQPLGI